jgi:hypothetical protein
MVVITAVVFIIAEITYRRNKIRRESLEKEDKPDIVN